MITRSRIMKENEKETTTTTYLPRELIIQILLRLPMLSLLRFKCVCKLLFSTISDPNFANSYFQISSQTHNPTILFATNIASKILSINYESSLKYYTEIPKPDFMQTNPEIRIYTMSSCRGFIYLHLETFICIWNPCTGVQRQLHVSPHELNRLRNTDFYLYGFGYDRLRDDYLVILVSHNHFYHSSDVYSCFEVFSLRDNTWKEIESTELNLNYNYNTPSNRCLYPKIGSIFNEAIHWVAFDEDTMMEVVIAFDIVERKLVQIPFPDNFFSDDESSEEIEYNDFNVWKFGEFLSLWGAVEFEQIEIWVLKEYKDHSSWIKTLVLPMDSTPSQLFSPICYTKSGDIVGKQYGYYGLKKYNDKGQLLQRKLYCEMSKMNMYTKLYTELYIGSLLSLPDDNVQDEEDDTNKKNKKIAESHSRKRKKSKTLRKRKR